MSRTTRRLTDSMVTYMSRRMEEEMYGSLVVSPRQYEELVNLAPESVHMQGRALDIRSSPFIEDNRAYMLSGTHEDGVTIILDEVGSCAPEVGYDGLNAELAEAEMRREATRTGWTIQGNTSGFEAGDQLNVRSVDGREGISRVVSTDNGLFNIDPIRWEQWHGAVNSEGATLSPELIERAAARGESFGRVTPDIWNREYGGSLTRVGNGIDWSLGAPEGSMESPYKLEFGTGQLIARKEGWYAFSHLPEWIVQLETGIVEFDENDFPKYILDKKKLV